jgi:integrase
LTCSETVSKLPISEKPRRAKGEGSWFQMPGGRIRLKLTLADGSEKALYRRNREEVLGKLETLRLAEERGELVTSGKFPDARWLEQWLEDFVKVRNALTTYEKYRGLITRHVARELGHLAIADIRGPHIRRLYSKLHAQGYRAGTIIVVHAIVHGSLRDAKTMGLVGRNYADDIKLPQRNRDVSKRPFAEDELGRLLPAMVGHRHEWLWRTMLETGLRIGEASALRWDAVDFERRRVQIVASYRRAIAGPTFSAPKTRRGRRTIPLNDTALRALLAQEQQVRKLRMKAKVWREDNLVFPSTLGTPLREDRTLVEFKKIQREAGIQKLLRLHDLRHTFATDLHRRDVNPRGPGAAWPLAYRDDHGPVYRVGQRDARGYRGTSGSASGALNETRCRTKAYLPHPGRHVHRYLPHSMRHAVLHLSRCPDSLVRHARRCLPYPEPYRLIEPVWLSHHAPECQFRERF